MPRRCHVVAITEDLDQVLVFPQRDGWVLPFFDDNPRLALPLQVQHLISQVATTATLVHEAPLVNALAAKNECDVRFVVLTSGPVMVPASRFVSSDALLNRRASLPIHQQALSSTLERLRRPLAPFDSIAGVADAWKWCSEAVAGAGRGRVEACTPHRCARYEYVASVQTSTGRAYFKAGPHRVDDEARLTMLLWDLADRTFPKTIAIDAQHKRWLYDELSGDLLTGQTFTATSAVAAVQALASIQRRVAACPAIERHLKSRALTARDIITRTDDIVHALSSTGGEEDILPDEWDSSQARRERTAKEIDDLALPLTLVLSDFRSRNILNTPHGIGFIDVERSYWSYPFLALGPLLREAELRFSNGPALRSFLLKTYVDAWTGVVAPPAMRRGLAHFGAIGRWFNLILASAELDLEECALGQPLPLGYRLRRLAAHLRAVLTAEADGHTDPSAQSVRAAPPASTTTPSE